MGDNDGWEDVSDPAEVRAARTLGALPKAPPSKTGGGAATPQDRKALDQLRANVDATQEALQPAEEFARREDRFHTGTSKAALFGAFYPDTSGVLGGLKSVGAAALRGTVGQLFSNQEHDDYQYLASRAAALNNAGLRANKGVQTEGDAVRIARENIGVDKGSQTNRDILDGHRLEYAQARAHEQAASKWIAAFGSLTGTKNAHGLTYDDWYRNVIQPQVRQHFYQQQQQHAQAAQNGGGWAIQRIK